MRILMATPEIYGLAKTGGLGDVSAALPAALAELGAETRVLLPAYPQALDALEGSRTVARLGDPLGVGETRLLGGRIAPGGQSAWLVDCPNLFRRAGSLYQDAAGADWPDNHLRFALLARVGALLCDRAASPARWRPDVAHGNDWQTGLLPAYLAAAGGARPATVFTIHNLAFQGLFPAQVFPRLGLPAAAFAVNGVEYYGKVSFLKAGIYYSDRLTTVSPTYAREIQTAPEGRGLEGLLAARRGDLVGILNGVDYGVWDPATDRLLARTYGPQDLSGKAACKAALQEQLGLAPAPDAPMFAMIGRLTAQKGVDLLLDALPALLAAGAQLALLGGGEVALERSLRAAAAARPDRVAVHIGYDESLAHRIQGGADMIVAPSRFEPCGLTHLYGMRYGAPPIAHRVGGLADTVTDATAATLGDDAATGFLFDAPTAAALRGAAARALAMYRQPAAWRRLQLRAMRQDFGWPAVARKYLALYNELTPAAAGRRRAEKGAAKS